VSKDTEIHVTTRILRPGTQENRFEIAESASLLEVMQEAARRASETLLPNEDAPLDTFHNIQHHDDVRPAIDDLDQAVGEYVKEKHTTRDFAITLVLAFCVNTRWAVATAAQMSPREILALPSINLDFQSYTLYHQGSTEPLPLDTPLTIPRGLCLEAQRDGKYGR